jgi:hypothetical protein
VRPKSQNNFPIRIKQNMVLICFASENPYKVTLSGTNQRIFTQETKLGCHFRGKQLNKFVEDITKKSLYENLTHRDCATMVKRINDYLDQHPDGFDEEDDFDEEENDSESESDSDSDSDSDEEEVPLTYDNVVSLRDFLQLISSKQFYVVSQS